MVCSDPSNLLCIAMSSPAGRASAASSYADMVPRKLLDDATVRALHRDHACDLHCRRQTSSSQSVGSV